MLLVQDSDAYFPFKNVGLDLLLEVGIREIEQIQFDLDKLPKAGP
jgi:hypothetical protein